MLLEHDEMAALTAAPYIDVDLLTLGAGRKRDQGELRALLSAAGFTPARVIPTAPAPPTSRAATPAGRARSPP